MKKRAWKRIISTLLIVCMLAGVAPVTQMQQVEAFDILGIVERMGCVVSGGMNAYETAKKEKENQNNVLTIFCPSVIVIRAYLRQIWRRSSAG